MSFTVATGFDAPSPPQPHVAQISVAQRRQSMILPTGNTGLPAPNFNLREKKEKQLPTTADIIFHKRFIN
jgi:hypothetical protein